MAGLAEQLQAVKLKKSNKPMKDFSSPKMAGFMRDEDIQQYEKVVLEVNTEHWIDILKDETFPSVLCPFKIEEARVFLDIYKRLYLSRDASEVLKMDWRDNITTDEKLCIDALCERLQESMNTFTKDGGTFVKTSSRSAKDAPLVQEKFQQLYQSELEARPVDEQSNENTQITCLLRAAFLAMKVVTSEEVVDMFLRSERIYQDLLLAAVNQKEKYNEHFVIRKFVDIDIDMEFRGFVYSYELTALSQYNYLIHSQRLVEMRNAVCRWIKDFYSDIVLPKLKQAGFPKHCIVDFAVCDEGKKIWVIEINPFLETTDGALFSWQHERHLLEGAEGFQFRITERPKPGAKAMLPQSVRTLLKAQTK